MLVGLTVALDQQVSSAEHGVRFSHPADVVVPRSKDADGMLNTTTDQTNWHSWGTGDRCTVHIVTAALCM